MPNLDMNAYYDDTIDDTIDDTMSLSNTTTVTANTININPATINYVPITVSDGYYNTYSNRYYYNPIYNPIPAIRHVSIIDGYFGQMSIDFDDININPVPKLNIEKIIEDGGLLIPKFNYEVEYKILKAIGLFIKNKVRDDLSKEELETVVIEISTAFIQKLQKENKLSYSLNTKKFRYVE